MGHREKIKTWHENQAHPLNELHIYNTYYYSVLVCQISSKPMKGR